MVQSLATGTKKVKTSYNAVCDHFRWYCLTVDAVQEPNLVRFFDRKVRQHNHGKHFTSRASPSCGRAQVCRNVTPMSVPLQDYYSVHGENAVFIAKSFYKTTAVVKTMGSSSNNLQGMPLTRMSPLDAQLLMGKFESGKFQAWLMLTDQWSLCRCDLESKSVRDSSEASACGQC